MLESPWGGRPRALEGLSEEEQQRQAGQAHSPLCPADGVPKHWGCVNGENVAPKCLLNVWLSYTCASLLMP